MEKLTEKTIGALVAGSEGILRREHKILYGGRVLKGNLTSAVKEIRDILEKGDKEYFVSFSLKAGRVRWLWISSRIQSGFFGDIIYLKIFHISPGELGKGTLRRVIAAARKYHKAGRAKVYVALYLPDNGAVSELGKNGFKDVLYGLSARTGESLKTMSGLTRELPAGYRIKPIDFKRSMEQYLNLCVRTMKTDRTSATYNAPAARLKKTYRSNIAKGVREKAFGLYFKDKLVGEITLGKAHGDPSIGLVAGIGILPEHRGKGLSKFLYRKGLEWFREKNRRMYIGQSSSTGVLAQAGKMKRKRVYVLLKSS